MSDTHEVTNDIDECGGWISSWRRSIRDQIRMNDLYRYEALKALEHKLSEFRSFIEQGIYHHKVHGNIAEEAAWRNILESINMSMKQ